MKKKKILIADDDYDIIASMLFILKNRGFEVATAMNGSEALKIFYEFKPEVIFLDLMMEKFDSGVAVCKKIRETDKNVRIYLVSSIGYDTADIKESLEMGFNGLMPKPITSEELVKLAESE